MPSSRSQRENKSWPKGGCELDDYLGKRASISKISEKAEKSITTIMNRLDRLEGSEIKEKSVESFFEISVIRERK